MCRSGLCTSTPAGGAMSAAVTSPGPCLRRYMVTGSSCSEETTRSLRFRIIWVASSLTPATVENSWRTPSTLMLVTAAPGMDDSRVRRRELPRVYPKPGSSGSMVNRDRVSLIGSSARVGRCVMSTSQSLFCRAARYLTAPGSTTSDLALGLAFDLTPVAPDACPLARRPMPPCAGGTQGIEQRGQRVRSGCLYYLL